MTYYISNAQQHMIPTTPAQMQQRVANECQPAPAAAAPTPAVVVSVPVEAEEAVDALGADEDGVPGDE